MAIRYTLSKDERLKREQHIETLFRSGKAFSVFPLRIIWHLQPAGDEPSLIRTGFSVSKKKFRHAVDRNRVKRLLREAWRLQKHQLHTNIPAGKQLHVFLIFTDNTLPVYTRITGTLQKGLERLGAELQKEDNIQAIPS